MPDRFDHATIAPADFEASLRFYRDILGWQVIEDRTVNGGTRNAQLSSGAMRIALIGAKPTGGPSAPVASNAHAPVLHLDIHDADARFARIPAGEHVVSAPASNHAGQRSFTLRDPDGNLLTFVELRQRAQR